MSDLVLVALIAATPGIVASIISFINGRQIGRVDKTVKIVEKNTNDMLTKVTEQRNAATTRADHAEGKAEGKKEAEEKK
jgi:hypothetical protein